MIDCTYKIIIAGEPEVGKTALTHRLVYDKFSEDYQSTIGVECKSYIFYDQCIELKIWDISGDERFRSLQQLYFRRSNGAILVFDLTNRQSFDNLSRWINSIRSCCDPNVYIILVGSKNDMNDQRQISETEAQNFANQNHVQYFEASSKTGFNVKKIFETLGEVIYQTPKEKEFSLSTQNLIDLPFDKYEQDFTFIVDGQQFKTSRIVADILSPTIRDMHHSDPTIDEFTINMKKFMQENQKEEEATEKVDVESGKYFADFLNLCSFKPALVDDDIREYFAFYFFFLGNKNEFLQMMPFTEQKNIKNAISYLETFVKILNTQNFEYSKLNKFDDIMSNDLISFIASRFYIVDQNKFSNLPLSIIQLILFNENLVVNDEDSFLSFIIELYEKDPSFSVLFGSVCFINVNKPVLRKFIENFMIDDLDTNIWQSICQRLLNYDENSNNNNNDDEKGNNENTKRYHKLNAI